MIGCRASQLVRGKSNRDHGLQHASSGILACESILDRAPQVS
jgi:hypothetical protein